MELDKCCGSSHITGDHSSFKLHTAKTGLWDKIINLNKAIYVMMTSLIWRALIKFLDLNVSICE